MSSAICVWIFLLLSLYNNVVSEPICQDPVLSNLPEDIEITCTVSCKRYGFEIQSRNSVPRMIKYAHLKQINFTEATCVDRQAPRFLKRCPHSMVFLAEIGMRSTEVSWNLRAIDNSGSRPEVTCSHEHGDYYVGEYDIMCKAGDDAGNVAVCEFHISVRSQGCSTLNEPVHGSLLCDEWRYGEFCFQECESQYDIPPGAMFPNVYICGANGLWVPGRVPDCILPVPAKGLILSAKTYLYVNECNKNVTTKIQSNFRKVVNSSNVLNVCEWENGCGVIDMFVDCAPAASNKSVVIHDGMMGAMGGTMTANERTRQEDSNWYERPQILSDTSDHRAKREVLRKPNWGYLVNITFSFALNFSATSHQPQQSYDWMTYLGTKELYDAAVFMQTQTESRMIDMEIPELDWDYQEMPFQYDFVSPYCDEGFLPSWKTMKCLGCIPGTYYDTEMKDCTTCKPNHYQDEIAQTGCKLCPNGTVTSTERLATSIEACQLQ